MAATNVTKYDLLLMGEPSSSVMDFCGGSSIKEIAINEDRRSKKRGLLDSDVDDDSISRNTAAYLKLFHTTLHSMASKSPVEVEAAIQKYNCSVGFLKVERNTLSPQNHLWVVLPVTAKHNLQTEHKDGIPHLHRRISVAEYSKSSEFEPMFLDKKYDKKLPLDNEGKLFWDEGIDISVGSPIRHSSIPATKDEKSVFAIKKDFIIREGQSIGIAVIRPEELTPESAGLHRRDARKITPIFGEAGPHLYVGSVTKVGEDHFEHDINTFGGCSGALIVLLEGDSDLVLPTDIGCAIAVHVGHHPGMIGNLGIKLWSAPGIRSATLAAPEVTAASAESPTKKARIG
eukprot:CAMPEP_0119012652 /NCGR_PEP_ID=MMETSP1176-20130426/7155_1 /TAXON_ID=265551 /ORGANISM="Synedropsis recta cf, Strain CCMP1620" /LENGTH=343 /DNA_ID=CAMNT_0006965653 /DNA_START=50 /DNA_END=1081 /DNA_ORIENTATION=+